jgi:hypothetical protein
LFEDDPRFQAVDKDREREELFEDYLVDLERKVRCFVLQKLCSQCSLLSFHICCELRTS